MSIEQNGEKISQMYIGTPPTDATKIMMDKNHSKTVAEAINENKENITQLNQSFSKEIIERVNTDNELITKIEEKEQIRSQIDEDLQQQIISNKNAASIDISEDVRILYGLPIDNANVDKALQKLKEVSTYTVLYLTHSGNFTVPANVYKLDLFLVGGGGAGNRYSYSSSRPQYPGGGGGGFCNLIYDAAVTPGQVIPYTIGAGGVANGGDGGITTFASFKAKGGGGGSTGYSPSGEGGKGTGGGGDAGWSGNGDVGGSGSGCFGHGGSSLTNGIASPSDGACPLDGLIYGSGGNGSSVSSPSVDGIGGVSLSTGGTNGVNGRGAGGGAGYTRESSGPDIPGGNGGSGVIVVRYQI